MSSTARAIEDPFMNETDLLKQIALFQRKAAALADAGSRHQRSMRALYLDIVEHCRAQLDELQRGTPAPPRSAAST